jgi:hypothetical protein
LSYELEPYGSANRPATRQGRKDLDKVRDGHATRAAIQESKAILATNAIAQGYNMVQYAQGRSAAAHREADALAGGNEDLRAHLHGMVGLVDTTAAFRAAEHVRSA